MPRVPMIDLDGNRTLASQAGALVLIEKGYELADGEPEPTDLSELTRSKLDEIAASLGVEEPEKLQNKAAVIAAIEAAQDEE